MRAHALPSRHCLLRVLRVIGSTRCAGARLWRCVPVVKSLDQLLLISILPNICRGVCVHLQQYNAILHLSHTELTCTVSPFRSTSLDSKKAYCPLPSIVRRPTVPCPPANMHYSVLAAFSIAAQKRHSLVPQTIAKGHMSEWPVWTNRDVGRITCHRHESFVLWCEIFRRRHLEVGRVSRE